MTKKLPIDTVLCGDCLELLPQLPDESVDFTLFSPPYDGIRDYNGNWSWNYGDLGKRLFRVTKDGGMVAVVIGDGTKDFAKMLTPFQLAVNWVDETDLRLFECCIYQRHGNPGAWWNGRFRVDHEYILLFLKGARPKTFHKEHLLIASKHAGKIYGGTDRLTNGKLKVIKPKKKVNNKKCRGTIWQYATSNSEGNPLKLEHPATYPNSLAGDLIRCFSNKNDIVLDPMCGSGTTAVMAKKHGRRFIAMDIDENYCSIAEKQLMKDNTLKYDEDTDFSEERKFFEKLRNNLQLKNQEEFESHFNTLIGQYNTSVKENRFITGKVLERFVHNLLNETGLSCKLSTDGAILIPSNKRLLINGLFQGGERTVNVINKQGSGSRKWKTPILFVISELGIVYGDPNMVSEQNVTSSDDALKLTKKGLQEITENEDNIIPMQLKRKPSTELSEFANSASKVIAEQIMRETSPKFLTKIYRLFKTN